MPKTSQNILIFIGSTKLKKNHTPVKIAKSYMNRFTIDEDASFELLGVHDVPLQSCGETNGLVEIPTLFSKNITEISRNMSNKNIMESETHFIFAVNDETWIPSSLFLGYEPTVEAQKMFKFLLSKYHIEFAMVTIISMTRHDLNTKEMMEAYSQGEKILNESVHDDLDYFLEKLQYEKFNYRDQLFQSDKEIIGSYFFPKLTAKEKQLVESKNELFMETLREKDPNKILQNMKKSESETMYVKAICWRLTFQVQQSVYDSFLQASKHWPEKNEETGADMYRRVNQKKDQIFKHL